MPDHASAEYRVCESALDVAKLPATTRLEHFAIGSRTGAPTVGSGECSNAFAVALSPAAIITFPAPAASNVACEFLALRSPVCFGPWLMGPIRPSWLSAEQKRLPTPPLSASSAFAAAHIF